MSRTLAPTLFELGGKSANIVFADADMSNAIKGVTAGIFAACAQSCAAGSRALVARPIYDEFVERLVDYASQARLGDPMDSHTQLGPVGNLPQRQRILDYIQVGRNEGAEVAFSILIGLSATWYRSAA
ncbi:aldehyde dehydrogenase family protein [Paraburkholderia polaris]|uniref:aldehyde dehydrogenase family protein n=1 Tax=Paraburkholderia polaris TaxID=2728848 RepID=UPI002E362B58|nr:aldehyde dehydrogenase family protein [Paraburkholderia polaris]